MNSQESPAYEQPSGANSRISAQSRRQAWDWSLVLASQSVEVTVHQDSETGRWYLDVAPADLERARRIILEWRAENRGWHWRQRIPESTLQFHAGALFWVFAIVILHAMAIDLRSPAAFVTADVRDGQWWRTFTAVWLHADLGHLVSNAIIGGVLLGLTMGQYGAGVALSMGLLCGAAGNLLGLQVRSQDYIGLGASGWVMGTLGMLAARSFHLWRLSWRATRYVLAGLCAGGFLFVMFGTSERSDVIAHFGGFIAGIVLGGSVSMLPERTQARLETPAAGLFIMLTATTWGLALGTA